MTLTTLRSTIPFADGSEICSHIAIEYPASINFLIYKFTLWKGTPHIGAFVLLPALLPVNAIPKILEPICASS